MNTHILLLKNFAPPPIFDRITLISVGLAHVRRLNIGILWAAKTPRAAHLFTRASMHPTDNLVAKTAFWLVLEGSFFDLLKAHFKAVMLACPASPSDSGVSAIWRIPRMTRNFELESHPAENWGFIYTQLNLQELMATCKETGKNL